MSGARGANRVRFGTRTLFVLIAFFAVVAEIARHFIAGHHSAIVVFWCFVYFGVLGMVLLSALGFAIAQRVGAVVATLAGGTTWLIALWLLEFILLGYTSGSGPMSGSGPRIMPMLGLYSCFIVSVVSLLIWFACRRENDESNDSDESDVTTRLLEVKRDLQPSSDTWDETAED